MRGDGRHGFLGLLVAPFARRRAQICVPAAFIRKVKHFEQALLLLSGGAGYARCFRSVTGPAGASRRGREAYSCAPVWVANTLLSTTSSAARRLSSSARAASKQASTAWPCPGELLGESDRSVAGLRDFAKRWGRAHSEGSEGSEGSTGGTLARLQYAIAASPRRRGASTLARRARRPKPIREAQAERLQGKV